MHAESRVFFIQRIAFSECLAKPGSSVWGCEWKLMEMLEMAGLFKIRQWKLRDGREVEFAGIGGIAGLFDGVEWIRFRGENRLKRVISGTCDGNVDWPTEARSRNDSIKLVDDGWVAKIKRENRECNDLQCENRERRHLGRENVDCAIISARDSKNVRNETLRRSRPGTKADFISQPACEGDGQVRDGAYWCFRG